MVATRSRLLTLSTMACLSGFATAQPDVRPDDLPVFERLTAEPDATELRKLLVERYNAAVDEVSARNHRYWMGTVGLGSFQDSLSHVRDAGLDVHDNPADQVALLEKIVRYAKLAEEASLGQLKVGRISRQDVAGATYFRADAQIRLLRAKNKLDDK